MGETWEDRAEMLEVLANLDPQPESVPLNALVPVKGTPLENQTPIQPLEMVRMVATTRKPCVIRCTRRLLLDEMVLVVFLYFLVSSSSS